MGQTYTYEAEAKKFIDEVWGGNDIANPKKVNTVESFTFPIFEPNKGALGRFSFVSLVSTEEKTLGFALLGNNIGFFEVTDPSMFGRAKIEKSIEAIKAAQGFSMVSELFAEDSKTAINASKSIIIHNNGSIFDHDGMMEAIASIKAAGAEPIRKLVQIKDKYVKKHKDAAEISAAAEKYTHLTTSQSSEEYLTRSSARIAELTAAMDRQWKNIQYDKRASLQQSIAKNFYYGNDVILLGETGIGKTYSPSIIAKANNIKFYMIPFQSKTDAIDLHGADVLTSSFLSPETKMKFRYGLMAKAFLGARENYKNGKLSILLLDELFRAEDSSPLISSLSVFDDTKEYALTLPNEIEFLKVKTENAGDIWLRVDSNINIERQGHEIVSGRLFIKEEMLPYVCVDEDIVEIMSARGDLMTITEANARLVQSNVLKSIQTPEVIRIPTRAISIVATSNIGENYDVNMSADNALMRRIKPIPVATPDVKTMLDVVLEKEYGNDERREQISSVREIVLKFLTDVDNLISTKQIDTVHKINFGTVDDIIKGIDMDEPFGDSFGNIFEVLREKANHFATIESGMNAADIMEDRSVKMIGHQIDRLRGMVFEKDPVSIDGGIKMPRLRRNK